MALIHLRSYASSCYGGEGSASARLWLCHQIIRQLEREIAELRARLNQNSTNSSKPPSSDPPSVNRAPPKRRTGKKRGGQHGHEAHHRALVPTRDRLDILANHGFLFGEGLT